jgi:hypothetical protein
MPSHLIRFASCLVCALLLVGPTQAQDGAPAGPHIFVEPIAGAERPFNERFAAQVAKEAQALGLDASADELDESSLELVGTAKAASTSKGAVLALRWSVLDPRGAEIVAFTIQGTAPYRAKNPWEAIDGDTLRWFAAASARELEYALEATLPPPAPPTHVARAAPRASGAPVASTASAAPPEPANEATSSLFTRVNLAGVKGAPGDGNEALTRALAQYLGRHNIEFVPRKEEGAYVIEGRVSLTKSSATQETVSILWLLADAKGRELARIEQANDVPSGALSAQWGETAVYAAEGAADGLLAAMEKMGPRPPGG